MASTDNPLATGPLTETTAFRAMVQNGVCASVTSSAATVAVDSTPPVLSAPTNFTVNCSSPWSFGTPVAVDTGLPGVLVYDNSVNDLLTRFETGTNELGNEILLAGDERYLQGFSYEFWTTNLTGSSSFEGTNVTVRLRFYANDGTNFNGYPTPGTLLYDSGEFWLGTGTTPRATVVYDEFDLWLYALYPLMDLLPSSFTWTVQFSGLGAHDRAGVDLYSPPVVGQSYGDFWLRTDSSWELRTLVGLAADIAARAIASTNRVTISVVSTVTNANSGGSFVATRTWMATDACGNSSTCSQSVTVEGLPAITADITNQTVCAGAAVTWSVGAAGHRLELSMAAGWDQSGGGSGELHGDDQRDADQQRGGVGGCFGGGPGVCLRCERKLHSGSHFQQGVPDSGPASSGRHCYCRNLAGLQRQHDDHRPERSSRDDCGVAVLDGRWEQLGGSGFNRQPAGDGTADDGDGVPGGGAKRDLCVGHVDRGHGDDRHPACGYH